MTMSPVAVITGAGSGIGRSAAILFAREGYRVVLVGRTERKLKETQWLIEKAAPAMNAHMTIAADLSSEQQAIGVIDQVLAGFSAIDVLVNNAGVGAIAPIADSDPAFMRKVFADNLFSASTLTWRTWPAFIRQPSACIIMVTSIAAHDPFPGFFGYAATKAAMESLARSIVNEADANALSGIRAYAVAPGAVETPMLRSAFPESMIPRSKTLDPDTIAKVILDLASGRHSLENGKTIVLANPA